MYSPFGFLTSREEVAFGGNWKKNNTKLWTLSYGFSYYLQALLDTKGSSPDEYPHGTKQKSKYFQKIMICLGRSVWEIHWLVPNMWLQHWALAGLWFPSSNKKKFTEWSLTAKNTFWTTAPNVRPQTKTDVCASRFWGHAGLNSNPDRCEGTHVYGCP